MTTFDTAAFDLTAYPAPEVDAAALLLQPIGAAAVQPVVHVAPPSTLAEPSTLALALIGVATLAAYRGVVKRITSQPAARVAPRPLVKPRRRRAA